MPTIDIPRAQWTSFLDTLSRYHVDEPVSVDVLRADLGAQKQITHLPLGGISADLKGSQASIAISAGPGPGESISHVIADPLRVRLLRTFDGDDDVLEIEAADESSTLVYFEA
jgi:hypothetical protein